MHTPREQLHPLALPSTEPCICSNVIGNAEIYYVVDFGHFTEQTPQASALLHIPTISLSICKQQR